MRTVIIKSMEQLELGMEVTVRHKSLSNCYEAIVSNVEYEQKCRFLGIKPIRALRIKSVDLICNGIGGNTCDSPDHI